MKPEPMTLEVSEQFFTHGLISDDPPLAVVPAARRIYEAGIKARVLTADFYTLEELAQSLNENLTSIRLLFYRYTQDTTLTAYIGEVRVRPGKGRLGGSWEMTREQAHAFLTLRAHFRHAIQGVGRGKKPDEMAAVRGAQSQHKTRSK